MRRAENELLALKQTQTQRVDTLAQVRNNLKSLIEFIDHEKDNLKATETELQLLKSEYSHLQRIVKADRKAIDEIFVAQEERNKRAQVNDGIFGFFLGVLSSLLASV